MQNIAEEAIENLEEKLLKMKELRDGLERFKTLNEEMTKRFNRLTDLKKEISCINDKVMYYDMVDFLSENTVDTDSINLEIAASLMKDARAASQRFEEDGTVEYFAKSEEIFKKARKMGFMRLNEMVCKSTEILMQDKGFHEFIKLLDGEDIHKIQLRILQSRRAVCLKKIAHIKGNREFLFKSMLQQELQIFLKLFPWEHQKLKERLGKLEERTPFENSVLFEHFSFSILKEYFKSCTSENLKSLLSTLEKELKAPHDEGLDFSEEELFVGALFFISIGDYLFFTTRSEQRL